LKAYVYYTPSEFFEKIQELIENRQKALKALEEEIGQFETKTRELFEKISPLLDFLKDTESKSNYTLREIAKGTLSHFYG
jgi:uncharacterized protein YoxC